MFQSVGRSRRLRARGGSSAARRDEAARGDAEAGTCGTSCVVR
eukprot:COSAG01_NODE_37043_length_509_cov_0.814634_1_plen_42_part_10